VFPDTFVRLCQSRRVISPASPKNRQKLMISGRQRIVKLHVDEKLLVDDGSRAHIDPRT
jgi:hypothetical protein